MAKKPDPAIDQLKEDIDAFIDRVSRDKIRGGIVDRLSNIRDDLENPSSEWYHIDLYDALNPSLFLEQVRNTHRKKYGWVGYVEVFRNILVFLPILFTWLALSRASAAYNQVVADNSALANTPFLVLWEQGFNGMLPGGFHFSAVAIIDVVILFLVVATTIVVQAESNIAFDRTEKKAMQFLAEFDDLLLRINKISVKQTKPNVVAQALLDSINDNSKFLQERGDHFKDLLAAEQDLIVDANKFRAQQLQDLGKVSNELANTSSHLTNFTSQMNQSLQGFQTLFSTVAGELQAIPQSQDSLDQTLKSLEGQLGKFTSIMQDLIQNLDAGFAGMSHSVHVELTNLRTELTNLEDVVKQISNNQNGFIQAIEQQKISNNDAVLRMEDVVEQISNNQNGFIQAIEQQNNSNKAVVLRMEVMVDKLEKTSQNYDSYSKQFVDVYTAANIELGKLTNNLDSLSKKLDSFMNPSKSDSLSSTSTIDTNLDHLVKELRSLNTTLKRNWLFQLFVR